MKKQLLLTRMLLLVALLVGSTSVWATDVTILFGNNEGYWAAHNNASYIDSDSRTWTRTCSVSNMSGQDAYSQFGNTNNTPTVTLTATAGKNMTLTAFSVTMNGGSGDSKGTIYLYKKSGNVETKLATASVTGNSAVTCSITSSQVFSSTDELEVKYVGTKKSIRVTNLSYSYTAGSGPVDPSVTIDKTTIGVGGTATISGPNDLTIGYESDNTGIATVSDEGVITGKSQGTAKITATWSAVTGKYNEGSKEFTVNVVIPEVYEKVTSANQLVAGNKYILVATGYDKAMGAQSSSIRNSVDVSISDNKIEIIDQEVAVLTLGGETGAWTFLASDNDKYLALTSSSNAIHASDDATEDGAKWTISNDFQLTNVGYNTRVLEYNSGSPRFACYTGSQQDAVLFVKAGSDVSTTVSIASACTDGEKYYGTYSNGKAFRVPADVTVSTIGIDNEGKLVVTNYDKDDIVKANTGVMISSTTAGAHTLILTETAGTEKAGNMLKASGNAGIEDAEAMETAAPDCVYYRLTMHNTTDLGFYYGAENGAAFALAANKAYLAVPESLAKEGFSFISGEEETDGIKAVSTKVENGVRYNLAGQKVGADYKGIVIVNGKKYLRK